MSLTRSCSQRLLQYDLRRSCYYCWFCGYYFPQRLRRWVSHLRCYSKIDRSDFRQYPNTKFQLTFFNYLLVALPASVLMLVICWIWLQIRYGLIQWSGCQNRSSNEVNERLKRILKRQYDELGSVGYVVDAFSIPNNRIWIWFFIVQLEWRDCHWTFSHCCSTVDYTGSRWNVRRRLVSPLSIRVRIDRRLILLDFFALEDM